MLIRRYLILSFIVFFFWNGKKTSKREISPKIKSLQIIIKKKKEIKKELLSQLKEIEDYNMRLFETAYFLHHLFDELKTKLWEEKSGLFDEGSSPLKREHLKLIIKKKKAYLSVKAFSSNFQTVYSLLKKNAFAVAEKNERKSQTKRSPSLPYISSLFRENLKLTKSFARLTLAKSLLISLDEKTFEALQISYGSLFAEFKEKYPDKINAKLFNFKKICDSCYNLDSATIFAPQSIARLRSLTRRFLALLSEEKRKSFALFIKKQEENIEFTDKLEGCLSTYSETYQEIRTLKITQLGGLFASENDKRRKRHLKEKLLHIAAKGDRKRNKPLESELVKYFEKKSQKASSPDQSDSYHEKARKLRVCLALEDRFFKDG